MYAENRLHQFDVLVMSILLVFSNRSRCRRVHPILNHACREALPGRAADGAGECHPDGRGDPELLRLVPGPGARLRRGPKSGDACVRSCTITPACFRDFK